MAAAGSALPAGAPAGALDMAVAMIRGDTSAGTLNGRQFQSGESSILPCLWPSSAAIEPLEPTKELNLKSTAKPRIWRKNWWIFIDFPSKSSRHQGLRSSFGLQNGAPAVDSAMRRSSPAARSCSSSETATETCRPRCIAAFRPHRLAIQEISIDGLHASNYSVHMV